MKSLINFFKNLFTFSRKETPNSNDWAPWMKIALNEEGIKEVKGGKHNPRILEYGFAVSLKVTTDELFWCSNFVNWVFMKMKMIRTKSAAAISWLNWGLELEEPIYGCVMVDDYKNGHGHVAFFIRKLSESANGVFGGNQSDQVCFKQWHSKVRYFWPKDAPIPPTAKLKNKIQSKAA
jgi:uncharacterized protein (TIGR02594 family)